MTIIFGIPLLVAGFMYIWSVKPNKATKKTTTTSGTTAGNSSGGNPGGGGGNPGSTNPDPVKPDPVKPDPVDPDPVDPDPKPKYDKDLKDGTQVFPNDDTGPGEDTNNGVGAEYSTKDLPDNSDHMTSDDYQRELQGLEDANNTTREGGDSNTPSTPPPDANTAVDNNAQNGTGYGGIDQPTATQGSSVSSDQAGDSWDGPPL